VLPKRPERAGSGRRGRKRGFTLVELLVVVAIIALLVAILIPTLARARELTRRTLCGTSLHALGKGWEMYFTNSNGRLPQFFNVLPQVADITSMFNFMIYCGREHTTGMPDYINAGMLYKMEYVGSENVFVCPTVEANWGGSWYLDVENPWPVDKRYGTYMTYGRRRMLNYDDPSITDYDPRRSGEEAILPYMLWHTGVDKIKNTSSFSWMADRFNTGSWAMLSHVPGIEVLYMDGHVVYWTDPTWNEKNQTGEVLYDNGIAGWGFNWLHDDIWMIIDGYHSPPVGQGL